jgi:hypothetical protein
LSFTEKECNYAFETNKPVLAFLFKNPGHLRVDETDNDPVKAQKLSAFKKKLEAQRIVKYWEDSAQLVNDIKDSVNDIVRRRPGVGWIRGSQALDPEVYKELEDERRRNKELHDKLTKILKDDITFPSHLAHGDDLFKLEIDSKLTAANALDVVKPVENTISWEDLIEALSGIIYTEPGEVYLQRYIGAIIKVSAEHNSSVYVTKRCVEQARYQFEALGLIKSVVRPRVGMVWTLTDKGRWYISHLKALRRPTEA